MRKGGLEPPQPCGHMLLKHACIPISPLPHEHFGKAPYEFNESLKINRSEAEI